MLHDVWFWNSVIGWIGFSICARAVWKAYDLNWKLCDTIQEQRKVICEQRQRISDYSLH